MEKQTKLNEINSVVQQLASSEIADRKLAKASGSTNWLAFLKAAPARKTEKTNKLAQVILMKDLKTKDVSDDALQTAGISRQDLELAYYQAKQAQNKGIAEDARVAATDAQTAKEREFQNTINQAQVDKIAYDKEHPQVATSIIQ